jgi:transposase InsO family protein
LARICRLFGITRQAYYQQGWCIESVSIQEELIIQEVLKIRQYHRAMGTRKLYEKLQSFMLEHQIKMGRDALFDVLQCHNLLVRRKKRRVYTTQSFHRYHKYPNLIKGFVPTAINQLWVSDITYWKIGEKFIYISFITDAYSHKIVGYYVSKTLETHGSLQALKMALSGLIEKPTNRFKLRHHSDRGVQYCSDEYVNLLQKNNIQISMTQSGDPLENALAERINGILKEEYLKFYDVENIEQASQYLKHAVHLYNNDRPHLSICLLTPSTIHQNKQIKIEKLWKNKTQNRTIVNPF